MAVVETERRGQVRVIRMNRPERLNALGQELRAGLAETWCEFRDSDQLEVAVFTGTGRAFCAGGERVAMGVAAAMGQCDTSEIPQCRRVA